jgi:quercetin dioxygenase-like cupin family protein
MVSHPNVRSGHPDFLRMQQWSSIMKLVSVGSLPTRQASNENFIGTVYVDPIVSAPKPARVMANRVTFTPGARTNWHTHPLGQTLYVLSGSGRVQLWGGPIQEIKAGDTVWIEPGEKHWHGAGSATSMSHIAIHEAVEGEYADWMEPVTDEQFLGE